MLDTGARLPHPGSSRPLVQGPFTLGLIPQVKEIPLVVPHPLSGYDVLCTILRLVHSEWIFDVSPLVMGPQSVRCGFNPLSSVFSTVFCLYGLQLQ
jgi:hypothetical protein